MRKQNKEISLEEISINECDKISSYDTYFSSESIFEVCGMEIVIYNDEIAKAIRTLSPFRRDIVLLSYFANLTDREIACHLNTVRQSVSRSRLKALRDLRKYFEMGDCK